MRGMKLIVTFSLLVAALCAACGGDNTPAPPAGLLTAALPTATAPPIPTPTPETIVTGPHTIEEAFADDVLRFGTSFEVDVATGGVYVVTGPRRIQNDTAPGPGPDSADGLWQAFTETPDIEVKRAGEPAYRITSALIEGWSARGALLYLRRNNSCGRSDFYVFDPADSILRNLTTGGPQPLERTWSPDASLIALHMVGQTREREIVLIDTATAEIRPLLPGPRIGGEFIPFGWSDDGRRLGVYYNPGRDFCDLPDPPTPLPETAVEVVVP